MARRYAPGLARTTPRNPADVKGATMAVMTKRIPVPCTGKRRGYKPDRVWRGRSYTRGGARIREMRYAEHLARHRPEMRGQAET